MSPESLVERADKIPGRWSPDHKKYAFRCARCGKGTYAEELVEGEITTYCGCPFEDACGDSRRPEDRPSTSHNGANPSNNHGLADEIRAAIRSNPQFAFEGVLGASLTHKPGSKEPVARCPFHDDSRPSLRVNLDKATWYCDPCAKGGDLFNLAREVWSLDFPACAQRLAELLDVPQRSKNANSYSNGNRSSQSPKSATSRKVARRLKYEIRDIDGALKATHHRIEYDDGTKDMPWEPTGIKPAELPLFQIEKTTDSMDGETVVVCEGEKAAAALWERRQLAVGTVTGADEAGRKVHCDESLRPLLRFDVVLWPDNDEAGRRHMQAHGDALIRLGCKSVRRIEWREAPPKADAADFTGEDAALRALIDAAGAPPMLPAVGDKSGTDLALLYADRMSIEASAAYAAIQSDHREFSWNGFIKDGCTMVLAALIGAGKTTLAMNLARAWGLGVEFLGRQCRQSRTLVIVSPKEFEAWADTIGFWKLKDLIYLVESTKAHFKTHQEAVVWFDYLMQKDACSTFVLDTLFDFFGMPPNTSGDSNRIAMNEQAPLLQLVRERNYSGLVTGHAPKSEAKAVDPRDPEESFGGHTAWTAQHRMRAVIRRKAQGVNTFLTGRGGYGDTGLLKEELLTFDVATRLLTLGGSFSEHLGEAALPSMLEALGGLERPVPVSRLVKETEKSERWCRYGLAAGVKDGKIKKIPASGKRRSALYVLSGNAPQGEFGEAHEN